MGIVSLSMFSATASTEKPYHMVKRMSSGTAQPGLESRLNLSLPYTGDIAQVTLPASVSPSANAG